MNILGGKTSILTQVLRENKPFCRFLTFSSCCLKDQALRIPPKPGSLREPIKEGDASSFKYTKSAAGKWKSFDTFTLPPEAQRARPKAEPFVVSITVSIFLIYFLWLREENDVDLEMDKPLYERLPTLERAQLKAQIRRNEREGLDNEFLQQRLQEVNREIRKRQDRGY